MTDSTVATLKASLRGGLITPTDSGYDEARKVYNGMIDRRPKLIARCADVADVINAVNYARDNKLVVSIRGGGHNAGGLGVCDGGLVIDLSPMRYVRVDPKRKTVIAGGGALWGDVDHATHPFGLAVPAGIISTTGVGGLTLGGGIGHLTRMYGLSIDNVLAADVVTADGEQVRASADENPDLFWAIRGGGGNFGVVTSFQFRANPVGTVVAGPTFWPVEQSVEVMSAYREFLPHAPRELNGFFAFHFVPPGPPFPEELWTRHVCGVVWNYLGTPEDLDKLLAPILSVGTPLMHGVQPMPFAMLNGAFDALYPPGDQWYWRADFVNELSDEAVKLHAEWGLKLPTGKSTMHMYPIDGAAHDVGATDTPWAYRHARWASVMVGVDPDPVNKDICKDYSIAYWEALHPHSAGGAYVNMMMDEGQDRVKTSYGDNYDRLAKVKATYDPENVFRVNQNIQPAV
jgi:FAD binding domain-containing protein/berberine-like enzyme